MCYRRNLKRSREHYQPSIFVKRSIIQAVKDYNFDSSGIAFTYYQFMAQQLFDVTNRRLHISFLHIAAIDPTRYISLRTQETEAAKYLVVDGVAMKKHRHYNAWCQRANEIVSLGKRTQQRLGYYQKKITLVELIRYVKNMPIN